MTHEPDLQQHIRRLRRRVRLLFVERYGLIGAAAGLLAAAPVVGLSSRYPTFLDRRIWIGLVLLGAAIGCACGLLRRLDDLTVAISADRRTEMKERLSTAVALDNTDCRGEFDQAIMHDARKHFSSLAPNQVFRHRFDRPHVAFCLALVVFLGVLIVPHVPAFQSKTRRLEVSTMNKEGAKIEEVAKELKKHTDKKHEQLRKLAGRLEQLGQKMQMGRMEKKQAMLQTQRLSKQIQDEQDRLAKENARTKSFEQMQAEMKMASEQLSKHMAQKIAQKEHIPPAEALQKVASDKRMAELARKAGPLTKAEQKELEKAVAKYADPKNQLAIPPELAEALARLAQNKDFKEAMELMQKLAQKLQSGKMNQTDKEALQKQMEQLAKALKGTDLDKLAKAMKEGAEKLANMSPEELKKLQEAMKQAQQMAQALAKAGGT